MTAQNWPGSFEQVVLPHLDAAYNLARWLTRNEPDAQDAVQEAYLRAFRNFSNFRGGDARAWLLMFALPTLKRLCSKTTTARWYERRCKSSRQIFAKFSSLKSSKECLTGRSELSPACLQGL